jgi:hypothetical protein
MNKAEDRVGYWADIYSKRMSVLLLYKMDEITLDEAVEMGNHRDSQAFLNFVEAQMNTARRLKADFTKRPTFAERETKP